MEEAQKRKNRTIIIIVAAVVILGLGIVFALSTYMGNRCMTGFEVQSSVERSDSNNVNYAYYNGNILKYSRSGISAMKQDGTQLWNGGYEMKFPQVDICGDCVVAADISGKQFYVFRGGEEGADVETVLPIVRAKVSEQGLVAALLEDKDSNVLNIYNPYSTTDKLLVEIPTNVSSEGYPLDFDISPDGQSVAVAYMVAAGNAVEYRVNFYNFTEVGQDKNTLVGGKNFGENAIARIEFVGEDAVTVFYDGGYTTFHNMKQPEISVEKKFQEELRSMACSAEYVAVVTGGTEKQEKMLLQLYDLRGNEKMEREISYEYAKMAIYGEEILFFSGHSCNIVRTNGHDKFAYTFEKELETIFPSENGVSYTLIDAATIQKIRLKD